MTHQHGANRACFLRGMRHGIPIALGYFAVALTLGIAARAAGMSAWQATLTSMLLNASAGEFAAFTMIGAGAGYLEAAVMEAVANARYLLMSCSLSQKFSDSTLLRHRLLVGFYVTDELFGISMAEPGYLNPFYTYGAVSVAAPGWALGTFVGVVLGNVLPLRAVSALGVGLYGMFLAIIIPPARKSRVVAGLVAVSFAASGLAAAVPALAAVSAGTRTIILTVALSAAAALLFPVREEERTDAR